MVLRMIKSFDLENYGPITKITGSDLGQINLVLGKNIKEENN